MGRALLVSVVVLTSVSARAQTVVLPPVPELKLQFPVKPQHFSFTGAEVGSYANGPLRLFRAESVWWQAPKLQLLTFGAGERAVELDCRLLCQPVVAEVLAAEARLAVPSPLPLVEGTHVFLRYSNTRTPIVTSRIGLIHAGIAGAF